MTRRTVRQTALLAAMGCLAGCAPGGFFDRLFHGTPPASIPIQYTLGVGYPAGGVWYYPRENLSYDASGIASITPPGHAALTADREIFDPTALAGAHQSLQLPAILRVTNLENGRQILLRLNDRGPASPARILEVTPRAAELLAFNPDGTARVRVQIESAPSQALMDQLHGGTARLDLSAAPIGAVQSDTLPPPNGAGGPSPATPSAGTPAEPPVTVDAPPPLRLPEAILQVPPAPGVLWIDAGHFGQADYANRRAAQLSGAGATVERTRIGNQASYRVRIGPLASVAQADATLDQVVRSGVTDARIVVEQE